LTASPVPAARTAVIIAARYVLMTMSPSSPQKPTGHPQKWFPNFRNLLRWRQRLVAPRFLQRLMTRCSSARADSQGRRSPSLRGSAASIGIVLTMGFFGLMVTLLFLSYSQYWLVQGHRFSAFGQIRQCGEDILRMFVTGPAPALREMRGRPADSPSIRYVCARRRPELLTFARCASG
jgi:hypothetical protein